MCLLLRFTLNIDPAPAHTQNRIQGFGSAVSSADGAAAAPSLGGGAGGGARMLGFGNPRFEGSGSGGGGGSRPGRVTSPKALYDAAAAALGGGGAPRRAPFMREEARPAIFMSNLPCGSGLLGYVSSELGATYHGWCLPFGNGSQRLDH